MTTTKRNINIYRRYWMRVILRINNSTITKVAKEYYITYSHAKAIADKFIEDGLVTAEKKGRIKLFKLTDKGKEMKHAADIIFKHTGGLRNKCDLFNGKEL